MLNKNLSMKAFTAMYDCSAVSALLPLSKPEAKIRPALKLALSQALQADDAEQVASFGRWWLDIPTGQWVLSMGAASLLEVDVGLHATFASGFSQVVTDDVGMLVSQLSTEATTAIHCEFRIIHEFTGLRWLRLISVPKSSSKQDMLTGILVDITASKHAAMREHFSFESTRFLVGAHSLGDAITKVIQLVCDNLGWEWGAYWSLEQEQMGANKLSCQYYWDSTSDDKLAPFTQDSRALRIPTGAGLVGTVWSTARPNWVEDMVNDQSFLRRKSALACGLKSGYAFPVSYVTADGRRHSPGVMEFFSCLSRQKEAQLPNLSATIGGLIAQTVQRMEQQAHIRQLAQIDDLTGLTNRNHFHQLLDAACLKATASNTVFGVLFIDLDRFKPINDAFGHEAGNVVLREFAQRLRALTMDGGEVGRLGGDEFAILMTPKGAITQLKVLAERVLQAANKPFMFGERELSVSASIGISVFAEHGWTSAELMRNADAAMYRSKQNGRNALSFFADDSSDNLAHQSSLVQQLTMETELHRALVNNEFFLLYQPVFDGSGARMVAIEALIRWRRANGDIVMPDIFIPIAEQSRLIMQIGRWVVQQACNDLAWLHEQGFVDLQVNINMAVPEFISPSLPEELMAIIKNSGLASSHLCLELTEGLVMKQPEKVIPVMKALRQLGFKISLDDFGMGHSSLSRLKELPISSLKIDRSFVKGLPHDRGDCAIVRTILDLGRHMKLKVIAEGVETDKQLGFLRQFGCTLIQGFILSKPKPLSELLSYRP
jgi:diguanylate cyclase (GGDEF)-like protein